MPDVTDELALRLACWNAICDAATTGAVTPSLLRRLGVYGGAQGIWVDKNRTKAISPSGEGLTVGLLHLGKRYADDLFDDGALYHYPDTGRPRRRDASEIAATKEAAESGLPIFYISKPSPASQYRDVRLGWVEGWDDDEAVFLIRFGEDPPQELLTEDMSDDEPFVLVDHEQKQHRTVAARSNQPKFHLRVFQRYGGKCAVCDLSVSVLLDAAHLRPKKEHGSDHPANGLVLCKNHHSAFDDGLFRIDPESLRCLPRRDGPSLNDLGITRASIDHLRKKPHPEALVWCWEQSLK
ncbi:MAG TPA: HNH endonuclease [Thermoanaerobaculales bacterium]|nr:HNH endonuclease [Thermoanaerobaculales bacterium]